MNIQEVWECAEATQKSRFTTQCHGVDHWQRVERNCLFLEQESSEPIDINVCRHFAALHDCMRSSDGADLQHGSLAAGLIHTLDLELSDAQIKLLKRACSTHTFSQVSQSDPTIKVCHDADKLDLGRVFIKCDSAYLHTDAARTLADDCSIETLDHLLFDTTLDFEINTPVYNE